MRDLADVLDVAAELRLDVGLEVMALLDILHLACQDHRQAGLAGERDGMMSPLVGRHAAEEEKVPVVVGMEWIAIHRDRVVAGRQPVEIGQR